MPVNIYKRTTKTKGIGWEVIVSVGGRMVEDARRLATRSDARRAPRVFKPLVPADGDGFVTGEARVSTDTDSALLRDHVTDAADRVNSAMAPACARAGLRRIGPHKLRHRYVSRRIVARSDALSRSDAERLAQHALDLEPLPARGWDARLEPPAELGYELGHGPDPHYRDYVRDGPGLER